MKLVSLISIAHFALFGGTALAAPERASLVVKNATLVTMDTSRRVIRDGVVVIDGSKIAAVGTGNLLTRYSAPRTIDAQDGIVMPGMINLHNHTPMIAFRGIGEYNVKSILFDVMFPLEKELLDRELIYVSARHAAMEMALGGVTLVTDMYYHEDEVARGTKEVGIRGVLGETVIGFPVVDAPEPYGGLSYAEAFLKEYANDELIIPAVAPHAPYTVSPEKLREARALAEKYDAPLVMHMAEFENERTLIQNRFHSMRDGETVIQYLDRIGVLGENSLGAHVIYADETDMEILKKRGVGVGHNPKANTKGGNGLSPAWAMYKKGIDIGLGTDGPMSSNQLDIFNVMPFASRIARLRYEDNTALTPIQLVELATLGGARALDLADKLGSIEPGKLADLIILDGSAPNMQPNYDPYATIAYSAYAANVRTVIVNGIVIVDNRKLTQVDMKAHQSEWKRITDRVSAFRKTLAVEPHR